MLKLSPYVVIQSIITSAEAVSFSPTYILSLRVILESIERNYDPTFAPQIQELLAKFDSHLSLPDRKSNMTLLSYDILGVILNVAKAHLDLVPVNLLKQLYTLSQEIESATSHSLPNTGAVQGRATPYSQLLSEFLRDVHGVDIGQTIPTP